MNDMEQKFVDMVMDIVNKDRFLAREEALRRSRPRNERIERAREYPILRLLSLPRNNTIRCLFHDDRTPSLHYYAKSNTLYCFGACSRHYDAIDVYRKIHGATFGEALDALTEKVN